MKVIWSLAQGGLHMYIYWSLAKRLYISRQVKSLCCLTRQHVCLSVNQMMKFTYIPTWCLYINSCLPQWQCLLRLPQRSLHSIFSALYISPIFHIVEKRIKISLLPFLFPFICQQWPPWVKWCCPPALKQSRCKRTCGTMLCSQCSTRVGLPKGEPTFWGMMMDKGREAYIQLVITVLLSYSVFFKQCSYLCAYDCINLSICTQVLLQEQILFHSVLLSRYPSAYTYKDHDRIITSTVRDRI